MVSGPTSNVTNTNEDASILRYLSFGDSTESDSAEIRIGRSVIERGFYENLRIVSPASIEGVLFQRELEQIFARLYPQHNLRKEPISFLLSLSDFPNACFDNSGRPPHIVLTRALFVPPNGDPPLIESVDELAAIIAHEFEHREFGKDRNGAVNSKVEEGHSDVRSVWVLHEAGYDARAVATLHSKLLEPKITKPVEYLARIFDPHPTSATRQRIIETTLAAVDKSVGGLNTEPIPIAAMGYLIEATLAARHESWLDSKLNKYKFESASKLERLRIGVRVLAECDANFGARLEDLKQLFRSLGEDGRDEDRANLLIEGLADTVLRNPDDSFALLAYQAFSGAKARDPLPPLGSLICLNTGIDSLTQAREAKEIREKGAVLSHEISSHLLAQSDGGRRLLRSIGWNNFPAVMPVNPLGKAERDPNLHDLDALYLDYVPWGQHVKVAIQTKDCELAKALVLIGIHDTALPLYEINKSALFGQALKLPILIADRSDSDVKSIYSDLFKGGTNQRMLLELSRERVSRREHWARKAAAAKAAIETEGEKQVVITASSVRSPEELKLYYDRSSPFICDDPNLAQRFLDFASGLVSKEHALFAPALREILLAPPYSGSYGKYLYLGARRALDTSPRSPCEFDGAQESVVGVKHDRTSAHQKYGDLLEGRICSPELNPFLRYILSDPAKLFTEKEKLLFAANVIKAMLGELALVLGSDKCDYLTATFIKQFYTTLRPHLEATSQTTLSTDLSWAAINKLMMLCEQDRELLPLVKIFAAVASRSATPTPATVAKLATLTKINFSKQLRVVVFEGMQTSPRILIPLTRTERLDQLSALLGEGLVPIEQLRTLIPLALENSKHADSEKRGRLAVKLLRNSMYFAPKNRQTVIEFYCAAAVERFGKSQEFSDKKDAEVQVMLREAQEQLNPVDFRDLAAATSKALCTQSSVSGAIGALLPQVEDLSSRELSSSGLFGGVSELSLEHLASADDLRLGYFELLGGSLDDKRVADFMQIYSTYLESSEVVPEIYQHEDEDEVDSIDLDSSSRGSSPHRLDPKEIEERLAHQRKSLLREEIKLSYFKFWALPHAARALIVRELLDPVKGSDKSSDLFSTLESRVLGQDDTRRDLALKYIQAYREALPPYSRDIFMCALMSAARRSETEKLRLGQALCTLIENLDPFMHKVGQGLATHPGTASDLRIDLRPLKSRGSEPTRWELFEWIQDTVPQSISSSIGTYGRILGSGSLFVAMEVKMIDGREAVLSIQRPNADRTSETGKKRVISMLGRLREQHDSGFRVLEQLIDEGGRLIQKELDSANFPEHFARASKVFDGLRVSVEGEEFKMHVAKLIAHGPHFKLTEKIEGQHFDDLPEGHAADEERKRKVAMAILTTSLYPILAGRHMETDTHSDNTKTSGNNAIGLFDTGGMTEELPTEEQLSELAELAQSGIMAGGDFGQNLIARLDQYFTERGHLPPLLAAVAKELNSLGDFTQALELKDQLACLLAAFEHAHPAIKAQMMPAVNSMSPEIASEIANLLYLQKVKLHLPSNRPEDYSVS